MRKRRVVITGIGVVAPNGIGKEAFWKALLEGKSGISRVTLFDVSELPTQIAGEIKGFKPLDYMSSEEAKFFSRQTKFGLAAAKQALNDSKLKVNKDFAEKRSVILGSSFPNVDILESALRRSLEKPDLSNKSTMALLKANPFSNASEISLALNFRESSKMLMTSCTGGLNSVGMAYKEIMEDENKVFITGGTDGLMALIPFICFCASGMMSKNNDNPEKACRPFDKKRDGGVMSEGAGIILLESLDNARKRGAQIYGEIIGFGETAISVDYKNIQLGLKVAMQKALEDAEIIPTDIDYISAHAPSDPMTDQIEVSAIKDVFKDHAYRIPVSSIKSTIGNPFAASGPLQLIATLLSMKTGIIPPTVNYVYPDPSCDLDCVPNKPRRNIVEIALINSHGLNGSDSSIIVRKYNE